MAKPNSHIDWTVGNPNFGTVTVEPTGGKKQTGWTPGEAPTIQAMNWLFYNLDQWIKYFEQATDSTAALVQTIQSSLFSTNLVQESPSGVADGSNGLFTLSQSPSSPTNTFVFADSLLVPNSEYTITGRNIQFNGGSIPSQGATLVAIYVIQTGFSGQTNNSGGQGITPKVENRTLSSADISAQSIALQYAPFDPNSVLLDVIGEGAQVYGADFQVVGNVLSWSSRGLASVVAAGDVLRIQYFI